MHSLSIVAVNTPSFTEGIENMVCIKYELCMIYSVQFNMFVLNFYWTKWHQVEYKPRQIHNGMILLSHTLGYPAKRALSAMRKHGG